MTNLFDLTGSRAIVTGGTRGLGHGMAEGLMEAGASVVIFGSSDKVEQVAADFRAKGYSCQGVKANLASAEERKAGFEKAVALLGGLDIIINAAGIQRRYPSPDFPLEDWNDVIEVNLTAPFDLSQMAAREFLKKEQPYGKIVNIASMLSFFGGLPFRRMQPPRAAWHSSARRCAMNWRVRALPSTALPPAIWILR